MVAALIVPECQWGLVEEKYSKLRVDLPKENGEVKGRLLSEREVAYVVEMLSRRQVVFEAEAIDMGIHAEQFILDHREAQAEQLTRDLTSAHHENIWAAVRSLQDRTRRMPPQLYVQSQMTINLIARVLEHSTTYYAQRFPRELAAFHWVIDGKDRTRVTDAEDWWSEVLRPFLQSRSLKEPYAVLEGADYSHYRRFERRIPQSLGRFAPEAVGERATDLNMVMTEHFRFSSEPEPGMELVDILANATRRALMGTLRIGGWRELPGLMIHRKEQYIGMLYLDTLPFKIDESWPYLRALKFFTAGGKAMLAPRFLKSLARKESQDERTP